MTPWVGILVGAYIGNRIGLGPIGSLFGSLLGGYAEVRYRRRRAAHDGRRRRSAADAPGAGDELARAYRTLGLRPGASKAEARRAYHALAKKCHPDVLRARGADEREVFEATERMSRLNAAWNLIERLK